ncbi:FAD-linked oxidoreductase [Westerdykella ornata]|uniref:Proline dehydrogenase n=1 Tax=Westerdykella ornata TaxID=318751 RepID=A0A6A6JQT7_WESOR|nr:FAD-linked oxidoreductase [Westerdykella ornata]KAF2278912.1 FAD-linked oxidoreductase [Westerdykella ornata]
MPVPRPPGPLLLHVLQRHNALLLSRTCSTLLPVAITTPLSTRWIHAPTARRNVSAAPLPPSTTSTFSSSETTPSPSEPSLQSEKDKTSSTPLSRLPTTSVLRTYLITTVSSSPTLLSLSFSLLSLILRHPPTSLLSPERNPLLAKILKSTFYAQFCAGESVAEVRQNTGAARKQLGYDGIILEYARELLEAEGKGKIQTEQEIAKDVREWEQGMLDSIAMARSGDFIGFKLSGLGPYALSLLRDGAPPTPMMAESLQRICRAAAEKDVALLPGAEEEATNRGLEAWTLELQRQYNRAGKAVVYTTYQCYLKGTPARLAQHLKLAREGGWIAGVKLVRGAYLATEPRDLIWETKGGTDRCYDACAEAVLKGQWNDVVRPPSGDEAEPFPKLNVVLATHNAASIAKAREIRSEQISSLPPSVSPTTSLPRLAYAQLQGMADEISQDLVQDEARRRDGNSKVVKCMAFGTTRECLGFLMRRAVENREAVGRTEGTRRAMGRELRARVGRWFGLV